MYGDDFKDLVHLNLYFSYTSKDRWIGLRNIGSPNEKEERWKDRKGLEQNYQFQLIPCIAMNFSITRWTSTKGKKKK